MTAETITLILDIILFSIIGVIVVKSLWGLKQGLWKTSVSLVVSIIFYILVILLNSTLTGAYYGLDISFFYNGSFVINEQTIELTTIGETLHDVITALATSNGNVSLSQEALQVCDALAMSILAFVVFIFHMMITAFVIVPVISTLLYHLVLKPILGKNITKKHKVRIAGFFVAGLKTALTCAMLITPFSAIVNRVVEVVGDREFSGDVAEISRYTDAYSSSAFAKLFTSVRINGRSFDIFITDFVTTIDYGNNKSSSFLNEVEMMANIACDGIEQGVYDLQTGQIDYTKMLSEVFVTNVLTRFAESPLIVSLLPVVLSIVANQDNIKAYVDLTEVDWQAIEWDDQLNVLSSVYETFYDTGLVDKMFDQEALNSYELSREVYPYFQETFSKLDNSTILTSVMPYLMSSFAKSLEQTDFAGIFPIEVEEYKNIAIGKELSAIFDAVMILSDLSSYAFDETTVIDTTPLEVRMLDTDNRKFLTIGDLMNQDKMSALIDFLLTAEAIEGSEGENDYISSDNSTPINTVSIFNGVSQGNEIIYQGLLDSELISKNLGSVIKYVTSTNEEIKKYNIQETIDEVCSDPKYDWKSEIDNLLNILAVVYNNDILVMDEDFDFFDQAVANELKKITPYMDDSDLVRRLAEPIFTSLMGDVDIMGLHASDLYFGSDDEDFKIGTELNTLLDLLPQVGEIKDKFALEEGENVLDLFFENDSEISETLRSVLKGVYNSNILNHDKNPDGLNNFEKLLKNFLNDFEGIDFRDMSDDFLKNIRSSIGSWADEGGEIDRICDAFASLKNMPSIREAINKTDSEEPIKIEDIESSEIKTLLYTFSDSDVIRNSMGDICNQYFAGMMDNMGIEVDFNKVESWENEADNLVIAIDTIKNISNKASGGATFDLSNLDFASLRYSDGTNGAEDLGILLKSMYRLDCIKSDISTGEDQDEFGNALYNVSKNLLSSLVNESDLDKIKEDFNLEKSEIKEQGIVWCYENDDERKGVIDDFVSLIDYILTQDEFFTNNQLDLTSLFASETLDTEALRGLLEKVNDVYIFRSAIEPILKNNTKMEMGSLKMDKLNVEVFSNEYDYLSIYNNEANANTIATRTEEIEIRLMEINRLMDILDQVNIINDYLNEGKEGIEIFKNNEGENRIATIETILNKCNESKLFNTISPNYEGLDNDTSLFEDVVSYIMETSTLDEMVFNDKLAKNKEEFTKTLIKDITKSTNEIVVIENVNWKNEIELLCSAFDYIVNKCTLSLDKIDDITAFNSVEINQILTHLNKSYLTHTSVANLINKIYDATGIKNFSLQGDEVDARSIDMDSNLTFAQKVNLWNEDIASITAIYEFTNGEDIHNIFTRENLKNVNAFEELLPNIVCMNNIQNWKYDIIYNLFNEAQVSSLISGESEKEKADTIKTITSSITTKDGWAFEGKMLDDLVHIDDFHSEANDLDHFTSDSIYHLIDATFVYDESLNIENRYKRGYLASEVISTLLNSTIETLNEGKESKIVYDWKYENYKRLNYFEMNGLKGTMQMVQNLLELCDIIDTFNIAEYQNNWKNSFLANMTLMGDAIVDIEKDYYLGQNNSLIAEELYINLIQDEATITSHAFVGQINWSLVGITFKEKAQQIIAAIDQTLGIIS